MKRVKKVVIRIFTLMLLLPILVFTIGIIKPMERVEAASWYSTNAKNYYTWAVNNGVVNEAVYDPGDDTIKFITRGRVGTTGVKYRTIGWQVRWEIDWEIKLWYVLQRDGAYLKTIDSRTIDGYEYTLYGVKYSDLKALIKSKFSGMVAGDKIDLAPMYGIRLDAVFTVVENGTVKGKIDGDGRVNSSYPEVYFNQGRFVSTSAKLPSISVLDPTALKLSGTVRSTAYDSSVHTYTGGKGNGITGARAWDSVSRNGFANYFNKRVTVLGEARYPYHKTAAVTGYAYHNPSTNIYYAKPGVIVGYTNVGASDYGPLFASYFRMYRSSGGDDIRAYHKWPEASDWIDVFQGADLSWAKITSMYEGTSRGGGMRAQWFFKVNEDNTTVYLQSCYAIVINNTTYYGPSNYLTTHTFRTDGTAPNKPTFTKSHTGWTNTDVTVTIKHGSDNSGGSGTKTTYYRYYNKDTRKWTDWSSFPANEASKTLTFTASCSEYTVEAYSVDNVGNVGGTSSTKVYIDKTKPTVTFSPKSQSWINQDISVSMTPSDTGSGVKQWRYRTGTYNTSTGATTWNAWGSYLTSTAAQTVSFKGTGVYVIQAEVTDNAGNTGTSSSGKYYIDKDNPTEPIISVPTSGWTNKDVTVTIKHGTDGYSGVALTWFRYFNNVKNTWTAWDKFYAGTSYTTFTLTENGGYTIEAQTDDNVGRVSNKVSANVYIDKIKPVVTADKANGKYLMPLTVTLTYSDTLSGISNVDKKYAWSTSTATPTSWSVYTSPVTSNTSGVQYLHYWVRDKAGNETTGYFTYQMFPTNTKPVANFTVSPNPQMEKEPLTYTDTSYAGDSWDTIVAREWSYSRDDGATWSTATTTPPNSFSDVGNYKVRLRVKDNGNELSPGMWSDYCIRDLVIEPNIGVTASVLPNPTKAGQEVTFNIDTEGYVEKVWITFPNDFNVLDSSLPLTTDITPQRTSSLAIKYITPINIGRTISDSGVRLRQPYVITVSVRNTGGNTAAVDLYLDIKGSVLDNIITEILWN